MIKYLINQKILLGIFGIVLLSMILGFAGTKSEEKNAHWSFEKYQFPYVLNEPNMRYDLSPRLKEISGLCLYDTTHLLAIQDEAGIAFKFDVDSGKVIKEIPFGKARDYEGIAMGKKAEVFVLESDGDIFRIQNFDTDSQKTEKYETILSIKDDTEGLCHDPQSNQLLVALKECPLDFMDKHERAIFAFDLKKKDMLKKPAFRLNRYDLGERILKVREKYKFKPSGLALHPRTHNLYVIGSVGKLLVVMSPEGELLHVEKLKKSLLPQPEGIAFDMEGNLYIASEGVEGPGRILRFDAQ